jgi:hypothetical protein
MWSHNYSSNIKPIETESSNGFEEFWAAFRLKKGKAKAKERYGRILKTMQRTL